MNFLDFIDIYEFNTNINNLENIKIIDKNKYVNSVIDIKLHYITNINIKLRKQYIFIITCINSNFCKIHLFKKIYNNNIKTYDINKIKLIRSFIIDKLFDFSSTMDWDNYKNYTLYILKYYYKLDLSKIIHMNSQGLFLPQNIFLNYLDFKFIKLKDFNYTKYFYRINPKSYLLSQVLFEDILYSYGLKNDEISKIRYIEFKITDINKIFMSYSYEDKYKLYSLINNNSIINCNICNIKLVGNNIYSWYNPLYGNLCNICYNNKKIYDIMRKNLIIDKIKLIGKRILFKIELIKIKKLLENIYIDYNNYDILKKIFINYKKSKEYNNILCNICLDDLFKSNILSGSCGHCYHEYCMSNFKKDKYNRIKCPTCRFYSEFVKLYF